MTTEPISIPDSSAPLTRGNEGQQGQAPDHTWFGIFQRLISLFNALQSQAEDSETGLGTKAAKEGQSGSDHGLILVPQNTTYVLILKMDKACTILETTTQCTSGTCTATFLVNGGSIGGSDNAVSSSEQSQDHDFDVAAGDTISLTISANASALNVSFSIRYQFDLV